jgi:uncharacterized protein (TIGR00255 family)
MRIKTFCISMTGFSNAQVEFDGGLVSCELRCVNSRFFDPSFRMPDELRGIESQLRELFAGTVTRGKLECRITVQHQEQSNVAKEPDLAVMQRLSHWEGTVRQHFPHAQPLSAADILRWPGVLGVQPDDPQAVRSAAIEAARNCLAEFTASREREGTRLGEHLMARTERIFDLVQAIKPQLPEIRSSYQQRITERLAEALGSAAPNGTTAMSRDEISARLAGEAALFAMRSDVDEELSRLETHLGEVRRVLTTKPGASGLGKRLDFLMQELHREANTLGSKAVTRELTDASLEAKLLIEQMREQVQNIE